MKGYLTGVVLGAVPALLLLVVLGTMITMKRSKEARAGWNPRPVVVVAVDVRAGELLTLENVSQRAVPEQFVTDSNVAPEDLSVLLNHPFSVSAAAGDPLVWGHFADLAATRAMSTCLTTIHPKVQQAFDDAAKQLRAPTADETVSAPQPASTPGPNGTSQVVAAKEALATGATLQREQLELVSVPPNLMTDSMVPGSQLEKLVGKKMAGDALEGDVLLWQLLDPGGPLACDQAANQALKVICDQAAQQAVHRFRLEAQ